MINLLPYNQKKEVRRLRLLRVAATFFCGAAILVLIAGVLFFPTLITINGRYAIAQSQVASLEQSGVITKAVDVLSLESRTQTVAHKLAFPLPPAPGEYIATIRALTPKGISLEGFSLADTSAPVMVITGMATTRQVLQDFIADIRNAPGIVSVDSPVSNFVKSTNTQFVITVTFGKQHE